MTPNRHGTSVVEYPSELVIVTSREFDAPIELVFDVLTKPEHVRNWFALRPQAVVATALASTADGVIHPSVSRGRVLRDLAMASSSR